MNPHIRVNKNARVSSKSSHLEGVGLPTKLFQNFYDSRLTRKTSPITKACPKSVLTRNQTFWNPKNWANVGFVGVGSQIHQFFLKICKSFSFSKRRKNSGEPTVGGLAGGSERTWNLSYLTRHGFSPCLLRVGFQNHYSSCKFGKRCFKGVFKGAESTGNMSETTGVSVAYGRVKRCYHIPIKSCLVHKDSHTMGDFIISTR